MTKINRIINIYDEKGLTVYSIGTSESNAKKIINYIKSISDEDYAMLARENKAMASELSKLGYTDPQISDIANGAI